MVNQVRQFIESRSPIFSALFAACGVGLLAAVVLLPASGKIAIIESTFGIFCLLLAVSLLGPKNLPGKELPAWFQYFPLAIGIGVDLLAPFFQPIVSEVAFACALTCLLPLSQMKQVSRNYFLLLSTFLAVSVAYNVFYYYPLDIGVDSWGYMSVSSAINQNGHFTYVDQPTSSYYFPFPVMALGTAIVSGVTGLSLPVSLFIFPGSLIVLQPLLVFLVSRGIFNDVKTAFLSTFVVLTESAVTQYLNQPAAEPTDISLLMLFLLLLLNTRGGRQSRTKTALMLFVFSIIVAIHGAVALVAIGLVVYLMLRRVKLRVGVMTLTAIFLGYLIISSVFDVIVLAINNVQQVLLLFFISPSTPRTGAALTVGREGILFVWWALPAALALFTFLIRHKDRVNTWVVAGAGLLGLSFLANLVAPEVYLDRYAGLAAWLILAVTGGHTLRGVITSSRKLLLLLPLFLLISYSAVLHPQMSPQFALGSQTSLPTSFEDRAAVQLANTYGDQTYPIFGDAYSTPYLTFIRYQSGSFTQEGIEYYPQDLGNPYPGNHELDLVRASDTNVTSSDFPCSGVTSFLMNDTVNIIYDNSCDIFATNG